MIHSHFTFIQVFHFIQVILNSFHGLYANEYGQPKAGKLNLNQVKRVPTLMIQPVSRICCPFIKEGIHQRMYLLYINKYVTELAGDCRQTSDTKTSWSTTNNNRFHIIS